MRRDGRCQASVKILYVILESLACVCMMYFAVEWRARVCFAWKKVLRLFIILFRAYCRLLRIFWDAVTVVAGLTHAACVTTCGPAMGIGLEVIWYRVSWSGLFVLLMSFDPIARAAASAAVLRWVCALLSVRGGPVRYGLFDCWARTIWACSTLVRMEISLYTVCGSCYQQCWLELRRWCVLIHVTRKLFR